MTARRLQTVSVSLLCLLFVAAGVNHFVVPDVYLKIMPLQGLLIAWVGWAAVERPHTAERAEDVS